VLVCALDTSTLTLSLALARRTPGGEWTVVAEATEGPPKKQSELLPGAVQALLAREGLSVKDLGGMVVGLGPGSFTGLRIGAATAKALCYAARIPLTGASSLAALAVDAPEGSTVFPCAVARQGELYFAEYARTGRLVERRSNEEAGSPADLARRLAERPDAIALGPALPAYEADLVRHGARAEQLVTAVPFPRARHLPALARWPETFDAQALFSLEPHYVRASEAERNPKFPAGPGPAPRARLRDD
jgi:tRNA threonylcarbamoyladenosine biosynthesis protein TsaB